MANAFYRVFNRVREGVHGVDAPRVARMMVRRAANAVERGIAHVDVGVRHINLGAKHSGAVCQLAALHLGKACQVFGNRARAEWAVNARFAKVAAIGSHFVRCLLVYVGEACFDESHRCLMHGVEVVAGQIKM